MRHEPYRPFSTFSKREYVLILLMTLVVGQVLTFAVPEHLAWWIAPIVVFFVGIAFPVATGRPLTRTGVAITAVCSVFVGVVLRVL